MVCVLRLAGKTDDGAIIFADPSQQLYLSFFTFFTFFFKVGVKAGADLCRVLNRPSIRV
jgi:hypothetical protein